MLQAAVQLPDLVWFPTQCALRKLVPRKEGTTLKRYTVAPSLGKRSFTAEAFIRTCFVVILFVQCSTKTRLVTTEFKGENAMKNGISLVKTQRGILTVWGNTASTKTCELTFFITLCVIPQF